MSFILDALRKSELERQRQSGPSIAELPVARDDRRLPVALLAIGVLLRSQAVRFASAAVVILTVLKVFLIDMRDLTGIYQGLSLIGLGAVLLGIGWLYQRLLFPAATKPANEPPPAA